MIRMLVTLAFTVLNLYAIANVDNQSLNKGRAIYMQHCQTCHMTGIANAPKAHDPIAWQQLWQQTKGIIQKNNITLSEKALDEETMKTLINETRKGKGAMPPGAMCQKCTDQQYRDAIVFMMNAKP